MQQYISQGMAKPTQISKTLDPTEELTALSASPLIILLLLCIYHDQYCTYLLATIIADNISGTDVPIAKKVKPINTDGIPAVEPTLSTQSTRK